MLTASDIEALFTSPHEFRLARWVRPIVPVVFGVDDKTLATVKGAIEAVVTLAGHKMAETDPEQGANLMVFFFRDWGELTDVPDLDRLVPGIADLSARLAAEGATSYRHFRFEEDGTIRAAFLFLNMGGALADIPAADLALGEAAQLILLWGHKAFADRSPLARAGDTVVLRPEIAALIAAAYDPAIPAASTDPVQAMRLAARLAAKGQG